MWRNNHTVLCGSDDVLRVKSVFEPGSIPQLEQLVISRGSAKTVAKEATLSSASGLLTAVGGGMSTFTPTPLSIYNNALCSDSSASSSSRS